MFVWYADIETRLENMHMGGIVGLDMKLFNRLQSTKKKILTAQDWLNIIMGILKTSPRCVVVIDCISALCEAVVMEEGLGTQTRGGGAKLFT